MQPARVPALCVALVLAATGPTAARAGAAAGVPHSSVVAGSVNGAAAIDGGHFVAWNNGAGALRVLDDRTGERTDVTLGQPCESVLAIDGSHGDFLAGCRIAVATGFRTEQRVVNVATGDVTELVGNTYSRVGRYWVQGTIEAGDHQDVIYTNWHSGETRLFRAPGVGQIATPYDLDTPDLEPLALAGPEFVTGSSVALAQVRIRRGYAIHAIGPTFDRTVYRSKHRSQLLSVKGGLALWQPGPRRLFGYAYRSRRNFRWRISESAAVRGATERRVYYLAPKLASPLFSTLRAFTWR